MTDERKPDPGKPGILETIRSRDRPGCLGWGFVLNDADRRAPEAGPCCRRMKECPVCLGSGRKPR